MQPVSAEKRAERQRRLDALNASIMAERERKSQEAAERKRAGRRRGAKEQGAAA